MLDDTDPASPDDGDDGDLAALEHLIIDLRDSVVRPASPDVAVVHLAQLIAAARSLEKPPADPPR